ncbi:hypothetical protein FQN50_009484 [Emmonsiellopsis sp. PD_5]|nr:hypothetical protein FQN50_009484 [Emmonsiellopsis sp. PD_5]
MAETPAVDATIAPEPMAQDHINGEWVLWDSLSFTIHGLPKDITTFTLWASFAQQGDVDYIEIFENGRGQRGGKVQVDGVKQQAQQESTELTKTDSELGHRAFATAAYPQPEVRSLPTSNWKATGLCLAKFTPFLDS